MNSGQQFSAYVLPVIEDGRSKEPPAQGFAKQVLIRKRVAETVVQKACVKLHACGVAPGFADDDRVGIGETLKSFSVWMGEIGDTQNLEGAMGEPRARRSISASMNAKSTDAVTRRFAVQRQIQPLHYTIKADVSVVFDVTDFSIAVIPPP